MGGTLPAFAGTSFANEDNHTNKCRKQVDYFHETIAAENSLFRPMNSLFRGNRFPVLKRTGNLRRLFKSLCDFSSPCTKTALNRPNFAKFPVIFPVLREFGLYGSVDTIRRAHFN